MFFLSSQKNSVKQRTCSVFFQRMRGSLVGFSLLIGALAWGEADGFNAAAYVRATIARLELVQQSLANGEGLPSEAEQALVIEQNGWTADYYKDASTYAAAIQAYLTQHPIDQARIEELAAAIEALATTAYN